jgi:hypothetical protein
MSYYFDHIIVVPDFKGNGSIEELIGEDAYAPDIYLAIIGISANELRRSIEGSATLGVS